MLPGTQTCIAACKQNARRYSSQEKKQEIAKPVTANGRPLARQVKKEWDCNRAAACKNEQQKELLLMKKYQAGL